MASSSVYAEIFDELLDLSLEELAEVSLVSSIALGQHHTHPKGEFMVGYTFQTMEMDGNRTNTRDISTADVFMQGYMVAPTNMQMRMHMIEFMYGVTDDLAIMTMFPYRELSMDHLTMSGGTFSSSSSGIGDTTVSLMYTFFQRYPHRAHLSFGMNLPTGSIDERGSTPMAADQRLPYSMQLGSGTYDPLLGAAYIGALGSWSWGLDGGWLIRTETNKHGYSLGTKYEANAWVAKRFTDVFSSFVRLEAFTQEDIDGADPELNAATVPTADPTLRGGDNARLKIGASFSISEGALRGSRFLVEFGLPVYRRLRGPQLEFDWSVAIGFQWAF